MLYCCVNGCKTTATTKPSNVFFHKIPLDPILRKRWLVKSEPLAAANSNARLCSLHFDKTCYTGFRDLGLKPNAVPSIFPSISINSKKQGTVIMKSEREMRDEIQTLWDNVTKPPELSNYLAPGNTCKLDSPNDIKLWCLVQKQQFLIKHLTDSVNKHKRAAEDTKETFKKMKLAEKEFEANFFSQKMIIKCLQEKQSMLEEQIEIVTTVESE